MTTITPLAEQEIAVGEEFEVVISIDDVSNYDACNYTLTYDTQVARLLVVEEGSIDGTVIPVSGWNEIAPGQVIVVNNVPGLPGVNGGGHLAVVRFEAIGIGRDVTFSLEDGFINDNQAEEIPAAWGVETVDFFRPGDANLDGSVDTSDLSVIEHCICTRSYLRVADTKGDGIINSADITATEMIIAGLS